MSAEDQEPVGSFLSGLLAGTIGRFAGEGLLKISVLGMDHPSPTLWSLDLETASGLRYRLALTSPDVDDEDGLSLERETQFGYRGPDGVVVWAWPQSDGTWTPWDPKLGIDAIDVDQATTVADVASKLPEGFVVVSREIVTIYGARTETPVEEAR